MKAKLKNFFSLLIGIVIVVIILTAPNSCIALSFLVMPLSRTITINQRDFHSRNERDKLASAKTQWEAQNLTEYRIHIDVTTCAMDILVRDKTQATISQNTCLKTNRGSYLPESIYPDYSVFNLAPGTIDEIFNSLKNAITVKSSAPNGIECDGYYTYEIEYDDQLGYPRSVRASHHAPFMGGFFFCTLAGAIESYPEYTISVMPLP
jgi:hypothetical protein